MSDDRCLKSTFVGGSVTRYQLAVGEARLARAPALIQTILGSCVAGVFWNGRLRLGAMCHGALPVCPQEIRHGLDVRASLRYVDFALTHLFTHMQRKGAEPDEIEVGLFGGADVLDVPGTTAGTVGDQNRQAALRTVQHLGLKVRAADLGGICARVICLELETGDVQVSRLGRLSGTKRLRLIS